MDKIYNSPSIAEILQVCYNINIDIMEKITDENIWLASITFTSDGFSTNVNFLDIVLWSTEDDLEWKYDYDNDTHPEDFESFLKRMILSHIKILSKINFE